MKKKILSILVVLLSTISMFAQLETNSFYYIGIGSNANQLKWGDNGGWRRWTGSAMTSTAPHNQANGNVYFIGTSEASGFSADNGKMAFTSAVANNMNYVDAVTYYSGGDVAGYVRKYGAAITSSKSIMVNNGNGGGTTNILNNIIVDANGSDATIGNVREVQFSGTNNSNDTNVPTATYNFNVGGNIKVQSGILSFRMLQNSTFSAPNSGGGNRQYIVTIGGGVTLKSTGTAIQLGSTKTDPTGTKNRFYDYISTLSLGTLHTTGAYSSDEYSIKLEGAGVVELAFVKTADINNRVHTAAGSLLFVSVVGNKLTFSDSVVIGGDATFAQTYANAVSSELIFQANKGMQVAGILDFSVLTDGKTILTFSGLDAITEDTVMFTWGTLTGITAQALQDKANANLTEDTMGSFSVIGDSLVYVIPEPSEVAGLLGLIVFGFVAYRRRIVGIGKIRC